MRQQDTRRGVRYRLLAAAVVGLALTMASVKAQAGLPACTKTISTCGCAITKSGQFSISADLTSSSLSDDCIDIAAPDVVLLTHGHSITGPGGMTVTAAGINVLAAATNADLQFADAATPNTYTVISEFSVGLRITAPGAHGSDFECNDNGKAGILIKGVGANLMNFDTEENPGHGIVLRGATGGELGDFDTGSNDGNGILISGSTGVKIVDFDANSNTQSGIAISASSGNFFSEFEADSNHMTNVSLTDSSGNFVTGFGTNLSDGSGVELSNSNSNHFSDFNANDNGVYGVWLQASSNNLFNLVSTFSNTTAGVYLGCSATGPVGHSCAGVGPSSNNRFIATQTGKSAVSQAYGFAIDRGDKDNVVDGVEGTNDTTMDLIDENPNCDHDVWINTSGAASPSSCIPTP